VLAGIVLAIALAAFFGAGYLISRHEGRLVEVAERALPGPLAATAGSVASDAAR
jgi:hypothetical protein